MSDPINHFEEEAGDHLSADQLSADQLPVDREMPPVLGSWPRVYTAVLVYLGCLLLALTILSHAFSYGRPA